MNQSITASTQDHLDIETVINDIVILKNGSACCILETSSVNFDLLSEREQDAAIAAYSALLNSLSFYLQIIIRSKRMDITTYVSNVKKEEDAQKDPRIKTELGRYRKFVEELVTKNEILDKKFYVVIPYTSVSLKPASDPLFWFKSLLGTSSKKQVRVDSVSIEKKARVVLEPKIDHVIKEFTRINIKARKLKTEEIIELYYDIYNPESARLQKMRGAPEDYTAPIVEPKIIIK
jgi:type IV secretory pathway VirB4 component